MLTFIGLGLFDEYDISLKGLEAVREADLVYAEFYTSCLMGTNLEKMEKLYGKKVFLLSREDVEQNPDWLIEAKDKNICFPDWWRHNGLYNPCGSAPEGRKAGDRDSPDSWGFHCLCRLRAYRAAELSLREIRKYSSPL